MDKPLAPDPEFALSEIAQATLRELLQVWFDFERRLSRIELIRRLEEGRFATADYRLLLLNLRPQVIEGARWITRAASSFDREFADIRSIVIEHARDEHKDYELLEEDYVAAGGDRAQIRARQRNPGTEALHGYLMYRAGRSNPIDMLGAMWIIEGLGNKMASEWAQRIEQATGSMAHTRFLRYHGQNDETHLRRLYAMLERVCKTEDAEKAIVMTAKVVSRLYAMQLQEIESAS